MAHLPRHSPNYVASVCELASYLYSRYERDGQLSDLNEAVRACERGAEVAARGSAMGLRSQAYLARALTLRYGETGSEADLARALEILAGLDHEGAVQGAGMVSAMLRDTFARALQFRFERWGREEDLARAVALYESVREAGPRSAPELAAMLESESHVLLAEFERTGRRDALDRAITAQEKALAALPADAPNRPRLSGNLSVCLRGHYVWTKEPRDLQRAVEAGRQALPAGSMSDDGAAYDQLGSCLAYRYLDPRARHAGDLDEAINLFIHQGWQRGEQVADRGVRRRPPPRRWTERPRAQRRRQDRCRPGCDRSAGDHRRMGKDDLASAGNRPIPARRDRRRDRRAACRARDRRQAGRRGAARRGATRSRPAGIHQPRTVRLGPRGRCDHRRRRRPG